jgi:isopenicillin-N N-acyltransferase like protein
VRKFLKILAWVFGGFILLLVALIFYVRSVATIDEPHANNDIKPITVDTSIPGIRQIDNNWFRESESGLYEMYVEGEPFERGLVIGELSKDLIQYQEEVFTQQIKQIVPSESYLNVLKYFVGWFNRDLNENVPEEFRQEIFGVSRVASHEFDYIAPPYQRMLNYHAAHDIGHALQNMALVGCTAFATWGQDSEDSTLIIGRNFDFYVGDDFAKNKIIAFYAPSQGHKFMMVTFGGMTGVLSGMNEAGLTVTLNAAKSEIPSGSATPVSLVAREILQYASTIEQAFEIASRRKTFVAESFMIGSAKDKKAVIIEKSPTNMDMFESGSNTLIGTNHFQSKTLANTELNKEHMNTSASVPRHERVDELLKHAGKNTVLKTAHILRDQKGKNNTDIGLGNERAVNQLIAHHGIIFQPEKGLVWISTTPFQLGKFVCYDLNVIFTRKVVSNEELYVSEREIPADDFLATAEFQKALKFNQFRFPFQPNKTFSPDSLIQWNPESYLSHLLAGDYYLENEQFSEAVSAYQIALKKEVATVPEREHIQKNLDKALSKVQSH